MKPAALLGLGALGLLLSGGKSSGDGPSALPVPVPSSGPKPAAPEKPPPPFTVEPMGRHLTDGEKMMLRLWIPDVDLNGAILWWGRPASTFASEDSGHEIIALTTARGIYLRGQNHEITRNDELATLGHELVHYGQYRRGENLTKTAAELELPAYQTGLGIRQYLDQQAGLGKEWAA